MRYFIEYMKSKFMTTLEVDECVCESVYMCVYICVHIYVYMCVYLCLCLCVCLLGIEAAAN